MLPVRAIDHTANRPAAHPELTGSRAANQHAARIPIAQLKHLRLGQFRPLVRFPAHHSLGVCARSVALTAREAFGMQSRMMPVAGWSPSFAGAIGTVVCRRSQPEMGGIAAGGIVPVGAIVQHPQPIRDRAMSQFPGETMGSIVFTAVREKPIAVFVTRGERFPAISRVVSAGDISPERRHQVRSGIVGATLGRTPPRQPSAQLRFPHRELTVACAAANMGLLVSIAARIRAVVTLARACLAKAGTITHPAVITSLVCLIGERAMMRMHHDLPTGTGAMLRAVGSSAGALLCPNYSMGTGNLPIVCVQRPQEDR